MDAFESVVSLILEQDGFWVRSRFKVDLTKEEKCVVDRPSSPRWELDLVAYKGATNEVRVIECKSYLDSRGVSVTAFDGTEPRFAKRFKLFNERRLREVVFRRLVVQLEESGLCAKEPQVTLCLAAGKIASDQDRLKLQSHFLANGWVLWDDKWLRNALSSVALRGYENEVPAIMAKLLLRKAGTSNPANGSVLRKRGVPEAHSVI
jgi:hypothetical protein